MASPKTAGRAVAASLMAMGFLAMPLAAQKPSPRLGLIAGATFSTVSVSSTETIDFKSRTSFMAGGFAELPLSETVSLQPELLYLMKGANEGSGTESASIVLSYFEVPLLLRFNIPTSGGVRPHLYAGPAIGFKIACDVKFGDTSEDCDNADVTLKGSDWSAVFGGGLDIKSFTLGIRYDLGLVNVSDATNGDDSAKNRALVVYAGFGFSLH